MNDHEKRINELIKKVNQHEHTIAQLVEIVSVTNRKLTTLTRLQATNNNDGPPQNQFISPQ